MGMWWLGLVRQASPAAAMPRDKPCRPSALEQRPPGHCLRVGESAGLLSKLQDLLGRYQAPGWLGRLRPPAGAAFGLTRWAVFLDTSRAQAALAGGPQAWVAPLTLTPCRQSWPPGQGQNAAEERGADKRRGRNRACGCPRAAGRVLPWALRAGPVFPAPHTVRSPEKSRLHVPSKEPPVSLIGQAVVSPGGRCVRRGHRWAPNKGELVPGGSGVGRAYNIHRLPGFQQAPSFLAVVEARNPGSACQRLYFW